MAVLVGNVLDLPQGKCGQTDGGRHKDALGRLARRLFENVILPHGYMIRLFFLQCLKKQVQRRLIIVVLFFRPAELNHGEHHFHRLLVWRRLMQQIQHESGIKGNFGFLPKGIVLTGVLRRSVLDEVVY